MFQDNQYISAELHSCWWTEGSMDESTFYPTVTLHNIRTDSCRAFTKRLLE